MSGGQGYSRKVHMGRLNPEARSSTPHPYTYHSHKKGTLFVYLLLTNGTALT